MTLGPSLASDSTATKALLVQLLGRGDFGAVRAHGAALSACATAKRWQDSRGIGGVKKTNFCAAKIWYSPEFPSS